jgi:death-on-curing protein
MFDRTKGDERDGSHDRLLVDYGGSEGVLNLGGLEGALGRPQNLAAYGAPGPDCTDLAAMYAVGIAKAHAFFDLMPQRAARAASQRKLD